VTSGEKPVFVTRAASDQPGKGEVEFMAEREGTRIVARLAVLLLAIAVGALE
jgi:hypothetical protein